MVAQSISVIESEERWAPPEWALLERALIEILNRSAPEFAARYTRSDGTLVWREEWPGMDGSDDPYEGFQNFPLFYVLGGSEEVQQLSRKIWDSITWQWTEYGQIHREFDAYYDWMHHGEGYLFLFFLGLADPTVLKDRQRTVRFARFYTGDDPDAPNYDAGKRLMRSPINGSRGPRFEMSAEDWSTHRGVLDNYPPPFEDIPGVPGPLCPWTDDSVYAQILQRMNERMSRGDIPLNLTATSMITHAYLYTRDDGYRSRVREYLDAWRARTERNGGIIPDNVGLSGEIGEYMHGKWWGGYYGWRWPHGLHTIIEPLLIAGSNAALLDGDVRHLDLGRSQIDLLWGLGREENGRWVVPHKHRDAGWTDYRPMNPLYPVYCWTISLEEEDLQRAERMRGHGGEDWGRATTRVGKGLIGNSGPWFEFIRGRNPKYPEQILRANLQLVYEQLERMRSDQGDPADWDIHHWQERTPVILEGLVQLTLGVPMHIYHGGLLHAPVRYYDADLKRPGLPPGVAALVEGVDAQTVTLTLVNLDAQSRREVVIQAGSFAEHSFRKVTRLNKEGKEPPGLPLDGPWVGVGLSPGAGVRLRLGVERYARRPSYETPWVSPEREHGWLIRGRG